MGELKDKIKKSKGIFLLLIGAVLGLLLIFIGTGEKSDGAAKENVYDSLEMTDKYISDLENRVGLILSKMDGIADVSVIITAESVPESVYAQNGRYDNGVLTEKEYVVVGKNDSEAPITVTLIYPKVRGVAVVCRGGSNPINKEKIIGMLSSLFDIPSNNVYGSG